MRILSIAIVALVLSACGHNATQEEVDQKNSEAGEMNLIQRDLETKNVYLNRIDVSDIIIHHASNDDLGYIQSKLQRYVSLGNDLVDFLHKKNGVIYSEQSQNILIGHVNNAKTLLRDVDQELKDNTAKGITDKPNYYSSHRELYGITLADADMDKVRGLSDDKLRELDRVAANDIEAQEASGSDEDVASLRLLRDSIHKIQGQHSGKVRRR